MSLRRHRSPQRFKARHPVIYNRTAKDRFVSFTHKSRKDELNSHDGPNARRYDADLS